MFGANHKIQYGTITIGTGYELFVYLYAMAVLPHPCQHCSNPVDTKLWTCTYGVVTQRGHLVRRQCLCSQIARRLK